MAEGADIVFMPYNYVIDESIRFGLNKIFDNAVIIFDEAHNVISVGEESQSFNISSFKLTEAMEEMKFFHDNMNISKFSRKIKQTDIDALIEVTD